ncbi:MAG: hypothetical protein JNM97_22310 [Rhodoferax sp.]|nr:hypothetical protein [Rhodoferax sp.]
MNQPPAIDPRKDGLVRLSLILAFAVLSCSSTAAQDYPAPPHQQTTPAPGARYEVLQSQLAARWTFKLDRFAGRVWQLVRTADDDSSWEEMSIFDALKVPTPTRPRFQLFSSGLAARHTFLLDADTGKTWRLTTIKRKGRDGEDVEHHVWESFVD